MPKNRYFDILDPLDGVFGANLVPYPQGHVVSQLLKKFQNQNFSPLAGGPQKDAKNDHFGPFLHLLHKFTFLEHLKLHF